MSEFAADRPSKELSIEQTISTLKRQLADLKLASGKWMVKLDVSLQEDFSILVTATTGAGKGVRQIISKSEIEYIRHDQVVFINSLADNITEALINSVLREELAPALSAAISNSLKFAGGQSTL